MSKKKSKTTSSNQSTAVSTPNVPSFVSNSHQGYLSGVDGLMAQGAGAFAPSGPNPLQQQAAQGASGLGQGSSQFTNAAAGLGMNAGMAGPNTAQWGAVDPAQLGQASQFGGAQLGDPSLLGTDPINIGVTNASAASLLEGLDGYMSPYVNNVVDTTLTNMDEQVARQRAANQAQAGANKAFGGSGHYLQAGAYDADASRYRASTEAGLRDQAFSTGASLSGQDADRRQQASAANAAAANQAAMLQAQLGLQRDMSNQSATNQFGLQQGAFDQQAGLANTDWLNQFMQTQAGFDQQAGLANQGAFNQNSQFNAGQQDTALARQMQAAGLMGDLGNSIAGNQRADVQTQSDIGNQQWQMQQMQQQYPLQFQQMMQQLTGYDPALHTGQTLNQTGSGTSKTKQTGMSFGWNPADGLSIGG